MPDPQLAAAQALETLGRLGLPPEPAPLAVFYAYHLGQQPDLRAALDPVLAAGERPSQVLIDELLGRFVGSGVPTDAGPRLETAAAELAGLVSGAGTQVAGFGVVLGQAKTRMSSLGEAAQRHLTGRLVEMTERLTVETARVSARLAETELAVATLRAELAEANRAALTDPLTRIGNRRAFEMELPRLIGAATTDRAPFSLLLFDIDHFKRVNDTWGHQVGDAVLRAVAGRARQALRESGLAARIGGEEFAALLPGVGQDQALAVAERIRTAVVTHEFVLRASGERIGRLTLSCGIAGHRAGDTAGSLVARADAALYAAKQTGRDRTIVG